MKVHEIRNLLNIHFAAKELEAEELDKINNKVK